MKKIIPLLFLFVGCVSLPFRITGWKDGQRVSFNNGQTATIIGNPRISCYSKFGYKIADGYFVQVNRWGDLIVDEFGKKYVWISGDKAEGNYCLLGGNN